MPLRCCARTSLTNQDPSRIMRGTVGGIEHGARAPLFKMKSLA
jgi:hypothetical protein